MDPAIKKRTRLTLSYALSTQGLTEFVSDDSALASVGGASGRAKSHVRNIRSYLSLPF